MPARAFPQQDRRQRNRLAFGVLLSLVIHGILLSLQFGLPGLGLPALELPWNRRADMAGLSIVIARGAPAAAATPEPMPASPPPTPAAARPAIAAAPRAKPELPPHPATPDAETRISAATTDSSATDTTDTPPDSGKRDRIAAITAPSAAQTATLPAPAPAPVPAPAAAPAPAHADVISQIDVQDTFSVPPPRNSNATEQVPDEFASVPKPGSQQDSDATAQQEVPSSVVEPIAPAADNTEQLAEQLAEQQRRQAEEQAAAIARANAEREAAQRAEQLTREQAAREQAQAAELARKADEQAKQAALVAEQEAARRRAEQLAELEKQRQAAALETQRKADEQAALEAKRKADEAAALEARKKEEAIALEASRKAEEAAALEAQRRADDAARLALRQQQEQEARRQAELEQQRLAAQQAEQARQAELVARQKAAAEAAQREQARIAEANARASRDSIMQPGSARASRDLFGGLASGALASVRQQDARNDDMAALQNPSAAPKPIRRRSVFGSLDQEIDVRAYVDNWRMKIERNGNLNYSQAAKDKARGNPLVTVVIRSDGSIEEIVIDRSSGRPELDDAVRRIVRVNARYAAFPSDMARKYDTIEIRRVWDFGDRLRLLEDVR